MKLVKTTQSSTAEVTTDSNMLTFLAGVSEEYLRSTVERIAVPRHRLAESKANEEVATWIAAEFERLGLHVFRQGAFGNVVGSFCRDFSDVRILIGAHFDTVPGSPGADDNGSAVAAMLGVAKALAIAPGSPVGFVAFNSEEDGMLGSADFVNEFLVNAGVELELAHILEMVGYRDERPGSQRVPAGLPIKLSDRGDFIGVLANRHSNHAIERTLELASQCVPRLPVTALKIYWGVEKFFPHLLRSDHFPFWAERLPALMWTDTAEFRNPNYHQPSDVPETLDYQFIKNVSELLVAQVVDHLTLRHAEGRR